MLKNTEITEGEDDRVAEKKYSGRPGIAIIIFGLIMVYIIFFLITFLFKKDVKIYEVTSGKVVQSLDVPGIILREEEPGKEKEAGKSVYLKLPGAKVKVGDPIYYTDNSRESSDGFTDVLLDGEDKTNITDLVRAYRTDYDINSFKGLYDVSSGIKTIAVNAAAKDSGRFPSGTVESQTPGYIVYYTDGYEGLKEEDISVELFEKGKEKKDSENGYKIITSDIWNIYVRLNENDISQYGLKDKSVVYVDLKKTDTPVRGNFELIDKGGVKYGKITLNKYVMLYSYDRITDIELSSSSDTGLQVPNTAIVAKEYYSVPEEYLTKGGNSNKTGFMVQTGNNVNFQEISVSAKKDGECFINKDSISEGTVLVRPDSDDRYTVKKTGMVDGVFCVNAGYTDFYPVEIIQSSKEYSLVRESQTGLSIYDRILLQAAGHEENEVIY